MKNGVQTICPLPMWPLDSPLPPGSGCFFNNNVALCIATVVFYQCDRLLDHHYHCFTKIPLTARILSCRRSNKSPELVLERVRPGVESPGRPKQVQVQVLTQPVPAQSKRF